MHPHKGWLNVSTVLGDISMPSAAGQSISAAREHTPTFANQLTSVSCEVGFDPTVRDGAYLWYKVLYTTYSFDYNIRF